jgi:hypothetical protein
MTAVIDEVVVAGEDPVGEPVLTQELPDVLLCIELGTLRRQRNDADVGGHRELRGGVPSRLIQQQCRVTARRDFGGDGGELEVHRLGVAPWQDQPDGFSLCRTDRTENIGRCGAEVPRSRGPRAASCPAAGDLVLLAEARFVPEPDFYLGDIDALLASDVCQRLGEVFLNASMAPSA